MSVFYLVIKNIKRGGGRSAIGAAAYCARSRLCRACDGQEYDFSEAGGLVHSEVILGPGAPRFWEDRYVLWNEVESFYSGSTETMALEIEAVVPDGLTDEDGVNAAREFAVVQFFPWGRLIDLNVHRALAADGVERLFVYALLPMKWSNRYGWGRDRERWWLGPNIITEWRLTWARLVNERLMKVGFTTRIGPKVGETRGRGFDGQLPAGVSDSTVSEQRWRHGERLLAEPGLLLQCLTKDQPTFTSGELVTSVREFTASEQQYAEALFRVQSLPTIVKHGVDEKGEEVFSIRGESCATRKVAAQPIRLNREDADEAFARSMKARSYAALKAAVASWESEGLRVRGIGLTFERAKKFEKASGVFTVAVHGILGRWKKKEDLLESRDVLVVNEIRELSDAQKNWILKAVRRQKSKLVVMVDEEFVVIDGTTVGLHQHQTAAMGW